MWPELPDVSEFSRQVRTIIGALVDGVPEEDITITGILDAVDRGLTTIDRPGGWLDRQQLSRARASDTVQGDLRALRGNFLFVCLFVCLLGF